MSLSMLRYMGFICAFSLCVSVVEGASLERYHKKSSYNQFDQNPYISSSMRKQMAPYLLPSNHPMRKALDSIFLVTRATLNDQTFAEAGFHTLYVKSRSFIRVASHPKLPDYLIKVYLDSEQREKLEHPGWYWLVQRCEGVEKVQDVIKRRKCHYFQAPKKYIYPLPIEPSPEDSPAYKRQTVLLLVEDMHLVSEEENKLFWKTKITKTHLRELYGIITAAKGSSYRPDNIWLSKNGKLSFIDTEYPNRSTDYRSIGHYLSPEMRSFWNGLVKKGNK